MSQKLHISSLFSALALVCLCLVARVGSDAHLHVEASTGPIVSVHDTAD